MLWKPACEQLTLVQSDISPIDIASYLELLSKVIYTRVIQKERIKKFKSVSIGYSD